MKKYKYILLILQLVLLSNYPENAYSQSHWDGFLKHPDNDSLVALEDAISESVQHCNWGNADNINVVSIETGQQLFELIAQGNQYSFHAGLLVSKCLDGGELGDFYRSVGLFFEKQPDSFLRIIVKKNLPESEVKHMLTMLPLNTVDNISRKMHIIENRIFLLKNISEGSLNKIKNNSLSFLEKDLETLKKSYER